MTRPFKVYVRFSMPGLIVAGPMLWFLTRFYASTPGDRPIDLARTSAALTILLSRPGVVGELRKRDDAPPARDLFKSGAR
jgi:hypothetical protein